MTTDTTTYMLTICHNEDAASALSDMCARMECETHRVDSLRDLVGYLADSSCAADPSASSGVTPGGNGGMEEATFSDPPLTIGELERWYIRLILDRCAWRFKDAAKLLGIDRSTLYRKLKKYGIDHPE